MRKQLLAATALACAVVMYWLTPPQTAARNEKVRIPARAIPGRYIVVLDESYSDGTAAGRQDVATQVARDHGADADKVFTSAIFGY